MRQEQRGESAGVVVTERFIYPRWTAGISYRFSVRDTFHESNVSGVGVVGLMASCIEGGG